MEDKGQVHQPVSNNFICLDLLEMAKAANFNIHHLITKYSSNFLHNMVQYDGISALREIYFDGNYFTNLPIQLLLNFSAVCVRMECNTALGSI